MTTLPPPASSGVLDDGGASISGPKMLRRAFRLRGLATAPPASRKVAVQFPYTKTPNSTDATSFAVAAGEEVELLEWGKPQWVRVRTASGEEGAMQLPVIPAPAADAAAGYVLEGYLDGGRPAAEAVLG